jgi:hypothetical protein
MLSPAREDTMTSRRLAAVAAALGALAALVIALEVRAGGDKVAFPENYASGTLYGQDISNRTVRAG